MKMRAFCKPARYEIGDSGHGSDGKSTIIVEVPGRSASHFPDTHSAAEAIDLVTEALIAHKREKDSTITVHVACDTSSALRTLDDLHAVHQKLSEMRYHAGTQCQAT